MVTITPFEGQFCQKNYTIYSINNTNPAKACSHTTTSEECPNCKIKQIFRFYEPKEEYEIDSFYVEIYNCKCPNCGKEFEIKIKYEKED